MDYFERYQEVLHKDIQTQYKELQTQPVLFIGSGFSQRFIKTPTWKQLMKELEKNCPLIEMSVDYYLQKNVTLPEIAEKYSNLYHEWAWKNREEYPECLYDSAYSRDVFIKYEVTKILTKLFQKNKDQWSDAQKKEISLLKKIQPHAIITTNYDPLLEYIFPEYQTVIGQDVLRPDTLAIGEIFKIHGSTDAPETIVLTNKDYKIFKEKMKYLSAKLLLFFIEHPIFFIGYGISAPNILAILSDIREIIGFQKPVIPNLFFLEWDKNFEKRTTLPIEKSVGEENKGVILNHIVADSYEWIFKSMKNESVIDNIHPQHLRRFLARTYKLVKK